MSVFKSSRLSKCQLRNRCFLIQFAHKTDNFENTDSKVSLSVLDVHGMVYAIVI